MLFWGADYFKKSMLLNCDPRGDPITATVGFPAFGCGNLHNLDQQAAYSALSMAQRNAFPKATYDPGVDALFAHAATD